MAEVVRPKRLGDVLVAAGLLTGEQLQTALDVQRRSAGARLGEVLVALGLVTEPDLAQTIARQANLEFRYGNFPIDPQAVALLSPEQIRRFRAIPLGDEHGRLVVAFVDPLDVVTMDDVRLATGREIQPVVITERDLQRCIDRTIGDSGRTADRPRGTSGAGPDRQIVRTLDDILGRALRDSASDVHIEALAHSVRVRFRVDGALLEVATFEPEMLAPLLSRIKVMADLDIAERREAQDGRVEVQIAGHQVDVRISILPTIHGEKAVLRLLDKSQGLQGLEDLGMEPEELERYRTMIRRPYGMVLVAGPTGSGKTTTLMAALTLLNQVDRNIVTIEDPVEYQVPGVNQVQVNPRAGVTFADGLRAILRQDPDVVMVGEIRDRETAEIAVRSALTGHLVLSSIHTNSAAATPSRMLDMGIEPYLVGSALVGVASQRLVRRLCTRCRAQRASTPEERALLPMLRADEPVPVARGCANCNQTGYRGRIGIFEMLPITTEVRELISRRARADEIARVAVAQGMRPLVENGMAKVRQALTSVDEVRRVAYAEEM